MTIAYMMNKKVNLQKLEEAGKVHQNSQLRLHFGDVMTLGEFGYICENIEKLNIENLKTIFIAGINAIKSEKAMADVKVKQGEYVDCYARMLEKKKGYFSIERFAIKIKANTKNYRPCKIFRIDVLSEGHIKIHYELDGQTGISTRGRDKVSNSILYKFLDHEEIEKIKGSTHEGHNRGSMYDNYNGDAWKKWLAHLARKQAEYAAKTNVKLQKCILSSEFEFQRLLELKDAVLAGDKETIAKLNSAESVTELGLHPSLLAYFKHREHIFKKYNEEQQLKKEALNASV